jgi:hypothetical protein
MPKPQKPAEDRRLSTASPATAEQTGTTEISVWRKTQPHRQPRAVDVSGKLSATQSFYAVPQTVRDIAIARVRALVFLANAYQHALVLPSIHFRGSKPV